MNNINNKIKESHCSIQVSKLLKEKGFDVPCYHKYVDLEEENKYFGIVEKHKSPYCNGDKKENQHSQSLLAPTHAIAVEWLRVNFGIQLFLDYFYYDGFHYGYKLVKDNGDYEEIWQYNEDEPKGLNTPKEATEYALLYTLTDLIK